MPSTSPKQRLLAPLPPAFHAAPRQIATCLSQALAVMAEESLFVASFVRGEDRSAGEEWVYPGTVRYRLERLQELAQQQGLPCEPLGWPYVYGADTQTWVAFCPGPTA